MLLRVVSFWQAPHRTFTSIFVFAITGFEVSGKYLEQQEDELK